jgi:Mrp family chromosome partitioning ATPase
MSCHRSAKVSPDAVAAATAGVAGGAGAAAAAASAAPGDMTPHCNHQTGTKEDFAFAANQLSHIHHVVAVLSGKGGVGKSLVTSALAIELARAGYRVGILDADITGPSIPHVFGLEAHTPTLLGNLYLPPVSAGGIKIMSTNLLLDSPDTPVIWRGPVIAGAIRQFWEQTSWGTLDYLLVDMPPGTGDVALTVFQSLPVDAAVIVTSPQRLVSMIVGKACNMAAKMDVDVVGLVENMSYVACDACGNRMEVFGPSTLEEDAARYNLEALDALPLSPALAAAADAGTLEEALPAAFCPRTLAAVLALDASGDAEKCGELAGSDGDACGCGCGCGSANA